jgi:hypothetical protein
MTAASLEPGHSLALQVPHFWLRTTRDSGGLSGVGFVVVETDWEGALACVSAPTHLGHQGSVVDHLLGLYSPIEFCRSATEASLRAGIDRLAREASAAVVYVLLPPDFDPAQARGMHEALKAASTSAQVVTVGPQSRDVLPIVMWKLVADLLSANTLLAATLPKRLAVVSPAIAPAALSAAAERGQVVCLSEAPDVVAEWVRQLAFTEVCLPATRADLRDAILASAKKRGLDLGPVQFEIDREPSTSTLSGLAARQAAQRCLANALASILQVNDVGLLDLLFEQLAESMALLDADLAERAREKATQRDVAFLAQVVRRYPDLAVRSAVYASCGPAALVVGVVSRQRWHDAVIAAQFGNSKVLPVLFLSVDDDRLAALGALLDKIEGGIAAGDDGRTREYVKQIGMDWVSEADRFHLLRLARKSIVLFSGVRDLPWELASWGGEKRRTPLGTEFDVGRMTATQLTHIGSIVHRTIQEAADPLAVSQRVLMMWDSDIDNLLGQYLQDDALGLLEKGIGVDVLAPASRLNSIDAAAAGRGGDLVFDLCTRPKVLARLAQGPYGLIVVALHGEMQGDGRVALAVDDERILEGAFPEIRGHPVVLLNSCWSGRAVIDRLLPMVSGLAVQLMSRGAFQVVAPRFPVSARSAAAVTRALLRYGWLRSAARVLRRVRQTAAAHYGDDLGDLDTFWFLAYGDPTVSKFFELDGVWEFEDAIEKLSKVLPDLTAFADDPAAARKVLALSQSAILKAMAIADKWARTAITRLGAGGGTRATGALAQEASAELTGMLTALDEAKRHVDHNYQVLNDLVTEHGG